MENLEFNDFIKNQLRRAGYWSKFLSIFGFVIIALSIFNYIMELNVAGNKSFVFVNIVLYLILVFPVKYLYDFSKKINIVLKKNRQQELEGAFESLAKFFHFSGIFWMTMIGVVLLSVISLL